MLLCEYGIPKDVFYVIFIYLTDVLHYGLLKLKNSILEGKSGQAEIRKEIHQVDQELKDHGCTTDTVNS